MQADFGEFGGVVTAEEIDEVVLVEAEVSGVFLGEAPFAVAAPILPIGDVLLVDDDAQFVERLLRFCPGRCFERACD